MRNQKAFSIMLSLTIFYGITLIPWFFVWMASFFMFDDPKMEGNVPAMALFLMIQLYPLPVIVASIVGWLCYARRKFKRSYQVIAIPIIWALITGILFASIVTW